MLPVYFAAAGEGSHLVMLICVIFIAIVCVIALIRGRLP